MEKKLYEGDLKVLVYNNINNVDIPYILVKLNNNFLRKPIWTLEKDNLNGICIIFDHINIMNEKHLHKVCQIIDNKAYILYEIEINVNLALKDKSYVYGKMLDIQEDGYEELYSLVSNYIMKYAEICR